MAASDARPVPIKNTAFRLTVAMENSNSVVTGGLTNVAGTVSTDGAAFGATSSAPSEIGTSGFVTLDLTAAEMNGDSVAIKVSADNADDFWAVFFPQEAGDIKSDVESISGDTTAADNLEADYDGTGYTKSNSIIGTATDVTNGVTVATNNDKTGYSLSSAGIAAIWDALTSGLTTVGSIGKLLIDNVDAAISTRSSHSATDVTGGTNVATAESNIRGVDSDTLKTLSDQVDGTSTHSAAGAADAVWDEARADHTAIGSFGEGVKAESLNTQAKADVNTEADTALTDYDAVVPADLPTNFADLSISATTGRVDVASIEGTDATDQIRDAVVDDATRIDASTLNTLSSHDPGSQLAAQSDVTGLNDPTAASIADAVWDETLTGATHNDATSAGRRLREIGGFSIRSETAQAGSANSITLDTGASSTDEIYDNNLIVLTGGTGAGQSRIIVEYDGTSKVATVDEAWVTTPDATSVFQILADQQIDITHHGIAQAGTASSITLSAVASAQDDIYNGQAIKIRTSTGSGQVRLITDYNGTTKVATVVPDWQITPTSDSVYAILPFGSVIVERLDTQAKADVNAEVDTALSDYDPPTHTELQSEINDVQTDISNLNDPTATTVADAVWDEAKAGHVAAGSFGEEVQDHALSSEVSALNDLSAAEVNAEVDTALTDYDAVVPADLPTNFADLSITVTTGRVDVASIEGSDATDQIRDAIVDDATRFSGADIAAILADTNELQTDDVPGLIAALNDLSAADVNTQVLDVLNADTFAEPGSVPAATATLVAKIGWLYALARNKVTQTSTTQTLRNDADGADIGAAAVSDDGTTFVRSEWS